MVLDRLFLWIFTVAVLVGTAGIILQVCCQLICITTNMFDLLLRLQLYMMTGILLTCRCQKLELTNSMEEDFPNNRKHFRLITIFENLSINSKKAIFLSVKMPYNWNWPNGSVLRNYPIFDIIFVPHHPGIWTMIAISRHTSR